MTFLTDWIRTHIRFSHVLFVMLVALSLYSPQQVAEKLSIITHFFGHSFDWLIVLSCTAFLIMCFVLAFGRFGAIRLGSQDETPQFSMPSWLAMLFAAGMGTGLVFYGAAEPLLHTVSPPPTPDGSVIADALAARRAMVITYVHWGLHAWGIYTICALTIAYFTFRQQQPMLASSPLYSLWPHKKTTPVNAVYKPAIGVGGGVWAGCLVGTRCVADGKWIGASNTRVGKFHYRLHEHSGGIDVMLYCIGAYRPWQGYQNTFRH
jgi:choline-glycine betaine transporter